MTTFMFPGQGSQKVGMGNTLFEEFKSYTEVANQILGYSIVDLCLNDPQHVLNNTRYTQPALYTVSALSFLKKINDEGKQPNYLIGHSLGEYTALFAAGVFDFATGLKLVKKRGELMSESTNGSMAAVIGKTIDEINEILSANALSDLSIANYNSYTQTVLSGPKLLIDFAATIFKQYNTPAYIPLQVSGAFHSSLMTNARNQFAEFIKQFQFAEPQIPVIANVDALPYSVENISHKLIEQINHSVRWTEEIEYLLAKGEQDFQEIGPGNVLQGLVSRIRNKK